MVSVTYSKSLLMSTSFPVLFSDVCLIVGCGTGIPLEGVHSWGMRFVQRSWFQTSHYITADWGISWSHFTLPLSAQAVTLLEFITGNQANNARAIKALKHCYGFFPARWRASLSWIMTNLSSIYKSKHWQEKGAKASCEEMWMREWKWQRT